MQLEKNIWTGVLAAAVLGLSLGGSAFAIDQHTADVIVNSSACVGSDCTTAETFGFDTIRLKENNLRIGFDDTSTSTFPANDWEITVNDSANGGDNYFAITDITAGNVPFKVEAGAGADALVVQSDGKVGVGTGSPAVHLHVKDGNTPTLRLDQDNSAGFTPQIWDVAGNEANFFVRDSTGGSQLPFKIIPGADTDSLVIAADNSVGVGIKTPSERLHVKDGNFKVEQSTGAYAQMFQLVNNSGIGFVLDNTSADALYISVNNSGERFTFNFDDGDSWELGIDKDGAMTGVTSCTGCDAPSDRSLKEDFADVDREAILEGLRSLDLKAWKYKDMQPGIRHIGPMSQDFHAAFGVGRDKTLSLVDTFGVAAASIQALGSKVERLETLVSEQSALIEELRASR